MSFKFKYIYIYIAFNYIKLSTIHKLLTYYYYLKSVNKYGVGSMLNY